MTGYGYKLPSAGPVDHVRSYPESGRKPRRLITSAFDPERPFRFVWDRFAPGDTGEAKLLVLPLIAGNSASRQIADAATENLIASFARLNGLVSTNPHAITYLAHTNADGENRKCEGPLEIWRHGTDRALSQRCEGRVG
jgi:hypothetical protein